MWHSGVSSDRAMLVLLAGACMLAACGDEKQAAQPGSKMAAATAASNAPARDFCTLLTKEEVEAAAGWKVTNAENKAGAEYGRCAYAGNTDPMLLPPQKIEAGIGSCVTNMPCYEGLPDFHSSAEMAQWREKGYEGNKGAFEGMHANIVPLDGFGVPAIDHELAGMRAIEMQIGHKRVAYVTTWGEAAPARDLARKVLARAR